MNRPSVRCRILRGLLAVATVLTASGLVIPIAHADEAPDGATTRQPAAESPLVRRVPVREQRAAGSGGPAALGSTSAAPIPAQRRGLTDTGRIDAAEGAPVTIGPLVGGDRSTTSVLRSGGSDGALWPYAPTANPNRQVGRLVFDRLPGRRTDLRHCTATVVNSANKSTLVTAGHCVYDVRKSRFYTRIRFTPAAENGSAPYGVWPARLVGTTAGWAGQGAYRDDIGVVVVKTKNGARIADRLGAHGIAFNQPVNQWRTLLGYPVTDPRFPGWESSGHDLYYCQGTDTYHATGASSGQLEVPCRMTGGSSGGPWLTQADDSWMGTVQSVNSNGPADAMFAPYFDNAEAQLYQQLGSQ
jgi:V8-like Glu-specific endopeptidase